MQCSDGTQLGGRTSSSIALRGSATGGMCLLAAATTAGSGSQTLIDWGPQSQSAQATTRQSAARAVRITLDHAGVASRVLRVYYSPDASFANLVEVLSIRAPSDLTGATSVTVGFGGVSVRQREYLAAVQPVQMCCFVG